MKRVPEPFVATLRFELPRQAVDYYQAVHGGNCYDALCAIMEQIEDAYQHAASADAEFALRCVYSQCQTMLRARGIEGPVAWSDPFPHLHKD